MADPKGFLKYDRELPGKREVEERLNDYKEIESPFPIERTLQQSARCMDCGVPFCHHGCPLGNIIPEFNDAVYHEDWYRAYKILKTTNNFPEFTGRICPAPCESSCVLGINQPPVAIEHIEKTIAEKSFEEGFIRPQPPSARSGKRVAIVGSGPAGLAAAAQLNKVGHTVIVFERADRVGGLLRYGIPDFKLEKEVLDRRINLMIAAGIRFETNADVGRNVDPQMLLNDFDAIILCGGSTIPRDLDMPGRELKGVHFAMDFLAQNNKRVAGDTIPESEVIHAAGKHVVVIGGGDTGSDCVGTSNRHGAASVTQIELLPKPPTERGPNNWPNWPTILRTSTSHEEGCERQWSIFTKTFIDDGAGNVKAIEIVDIVWERDPVTGAPFTEVPGTVRQIPCDLALLAIGFMHPKQDGVLQQMGIDLSDRGNVKADEKNYQTNIEKVFTAGDMRRGQSLVVWAISEGREAARAVDIYLMGESMLETKGEV
ncbi:MAG: glutamate synthase subunit beta [Saprospiraceae bacterium]|nr:glutamate synthase subunit beta [Saprospiraceae bacterium]MCB9326307.1 glutamate synthase subunit beta [Lewinellaceae bacterium]